MTTETINKLIELEFPIKLFKENRKKDPYAGLVNCGNCASYESSALSNKQIKQRLISNLHFEDIWRELPNDIGTYDKELNHKYIWYYDNIEMDSLFKIEILDGNITEAAAQLWIQLKEKELI